VLLKNFIYLRYYIFMIMKTSLIIFVLTVFSICFASAQTDTIGLKDVPRYLNKEVTIQLQSADFDSRAENWYIYSGEMYPRQFFSIIIKKYNGKKRIKLNTDVLIGRKMIYYTGTIITYNGKPDSSANPDIDKLTNIIDVERPMSIGGKSAMGYINYKPKIAPVDLNGKFVMIISDQKQIGKKMYPVIMSIY